MRRFGSYLPFIALGGIAFIAYQLGSTFGAFMTIFAVITWAVAGLLLVYMVLFRDVKLSLFSSDPAAPQPVYVDAEGVYHNGVATDAQDEQISAGTVVADEEDLPSPADRHVDVDRGEAAGAARPEAEGSSLEGRALVPASAVASKGDEPTR